MVKKLYKSNSNQVLSGVCGGIGQYLRIDSTIIRLIWAVSIAFYGSGLLLYIIASIIIPEEPSNIYY